MAQSCEAAVKVLLEEGSRRVWAPRGRRVRLVHLGVGTGVRRGWGREAKGTEVQCWSHAVRGPRIERRVHAPTETDWHEVRARLLVYLLARFLACLLIGCRRAHRLIARGDGNSALISHMTGHVTRRALGRRPRERHVEVLCLRLAHV